MSLWLKNSGFMSHTIDFKSHGTATEWNGHWRYSDVVWRVIPGKQTYLINREPYVSHQNFIRNENFEVVYDRRILSSSNITRKMLADKFKKISDLDLQTSGVFLQAKKC
jgi:hypothetical protein